MVKSVKKKEKKEAINLPNITLHVQPMTETITKIKVYGDLIVYCKEKLV
jgi:hypothetical protein